MVDVYGIKNCSTVKKALNWLDANNVDYVFHDYKKEGISPELIHKWQNQSGWEPLLNRKGTTWRKLDKELQESISDSDSASKLMQEKTSVIKRPIIDRDGSLVIGFDEEEYNSQLL